MKKDFIVPHVPVFAPSEKAFVGDESNGSVVPAGDGFKSTADPDTKRYHFKIT
jgi:hypothetical protein